MVPLAQAAGGAPCSHPCDSAPCYHPSGVWLAGARLNSAQSSPGPQPCTLAAPGQRAVARAAGRRSVQAAGALHPASMCSVCSAVHRSSLSEIGLEMCVPMFLAP